MSRAHSIEKCGSTNLSTRGQVQPDLEQLERVGLVGVEEREHLRVHDAAAGGEPLRVAARRSAPRRPSESEWSISAVAHVRDGLEAAVRMLREAGHHVAVVHAPAVDAREVGTDARGRPAGHRARSARCPPGRRRRGARRRGRGRPSATGSPSTAPSPARSRRSPFVLSHQVASADRTSRGQVTQPRGRGRDSRPGAGSGGR